MNRVLFWIALSWAGLLVGLVGVCPYVGVAEQSEGWSRVPAMFAHDAMVRQSAIASAVGLVVAAVVFFRKMGSQKLKVNRRSSDGKPRTGAPMGA